MAGLDIRGRPKKEAGAPHAVAQGPTSGILLYARGPTG